MKRFMSIWFPHLITDWYTVRHRELAGMPLVFTIKERGRLVITAANAEAEKQGVCTGMVAADAKAIMPGLQVVDEIPGQAERLLRAIGDWCIRFTPGVAIDMPDGLVLDISGCAHLWGGEQEYLKDIVAKLGKRGYDIRVAIAGTIGTAWAIARFGQGMEIIEPGAQVDALLRLPPAALRLEPLVLDRLRKLGFQRVESFIGIKRSALRRRFGEGLLLRLDQALGKEPEVIVPLQHIAPYEERLPCMNPIRTAAGIEIAIQTLLEMLCKRLKGEEKGIRIAMLKCYRIDGQIVQAEISTNKATRNTSHLFKLFELKIPGIEPALGIELFTLEATKAEDIDAAQEALWTVEGCGPGDTDLAELLDRIAGKVGADSIRRYLPQEHYWPERSIKNTVSLTEKPVTGWQTNKPRPTHLLAKPETIEVTVPMPDYPPMLFRYKGTLHNVNKADGPERIEQEWWQEQGLYRDYYCLEDEGGARYWVFRLGSYDSGEPQWYIHGFFA